LSSHHAAIVAASIPDVPRVVVFIRTTVLKVVIAKGIYLRGSVCRPNREAPERSLQRFKKIFAKASTRSDRQIRIIGQVAKAIIAAISLYRKSRMKNDSDSRVRVKASAPRTVVGFLILKDIPRFPA
jgi:hypothetical protein